MNATGTITMTMRELDRFKVIQDVADGTLKTRSVSGHRAKDANRSQDPSAAD
ncbi:hypothetical protein [Burkholderia contaminans]|uniref:hypothetical protein n=1 Tax=Burkholderia contaminans TaxID=488447 RepID=UPI00162976C5|nr:hypothetical protein [Burkholderia contaminans]